MRAAAEISYGAGHGLEAIHHRRSQPVDFRLDVISIPRKLAGDLPYLRRKKEAERPTIPTLAPTTRMTENTRPTRNRSIRLTAGARMKQKNAASASGMNNSRPKYSAATMSEAPANPAKKRLILLLLVSVMTSL